KYRLNIEAFTYDVQEPLSKDLKKCFDVFISDPVETIPGIRLFLSRGVSALKGVGSSGYFGLTTLEASVKKWYEIQKILHSMGFVITDIIRKFSIYGGEENFLREENLPIVKKIKEKVDFDWYSSSFYRIEAVKEPKPAVTGRCIITREMYVDDESWATGLSGS
ncbi:MAG TPA: putative methyltransferase, partial [Thermoplasmatales archaeon]|nr:putative methyltransferase [Thermoplasmatales archaeon]